MHDEAGLKLAVSHRPISAQALANLSKDEKAEYEATHDMEQEYKLMPKVFTKRPEWKKTR